MFEHNRTYLSELLTQYGDVAGIWFDGIGGFYRNPENYNRLPEIHQLVRELQPHALVSFKEGAICDEDFLSPEHFMLPFEYDWKSQNIQKRFDIRVERWKGIQTELWNKCNQYKLREINTVMQKCRGRDNTHADGGWINDESTEHYSAEEVYGWLKYSRSTGSNMLMNIGPRGDGSIHPDDEKALTELGAMIEQLGWPKLKNEVQK
jgi:alpha-L-fucosidase